MLAIHSLTRGLQSTEKRGLHDGTHTQTDTQLTDIVTYRLNRPRGPTPSKPLLTKLNYSVSATMLYILPRSGIYKHKIFLTQWLL